MLVNYVLIISTFTTSWTSNNDWEKNIPEISQASIFKNSELYTMIKLTIPKSGLNGSSWLAWEEKVFDTKRTFLKPTKVKVLIIFMSFILDIT